MADRIASSVRCAIYTRKSTEEGLEQDFNTLDAQREAAEAYIRSQRHEGWAVLPAHYDDGGYTGANMDRPALKRLLTDAQAGLDHGGSPRSGSTADAQRGTPSFITARGAGGNRPPACGGPARSVRSAAWTSALPIAAQRMVLA